MKRFCSRTLVVLFIAVLPVCAVQAQPGAFRPDIEDAGISTRQQRLYQLGRQWMEQNYDESTATVVQTMGSGQRHSLSRESAYYAYALLLAGEPADREKAEAILDRVLNTQETRAHHFGTFSWDIRFTPEAPFRRDLNYTVFVSTALGLILDLDNQRKGVISAQMRGRIETAIANAMVATIRRDVGTDHGNIALLSAAAAIQADALLGIPEARAFGIRKLEQMREQLNPQAFLEEYLSPTYYGVNLSSLYIAQHFASGQARALVDELLDAMWLDIARSYHAPTRQLAGPHARSYGEDMLDYGALVKYFIYLAADPQYPIPEGERKHNWDTSMLVLTANMPIAPRSEFQEKPLPWRKLRVGAADASWPRQISQYRKGDFILGSVSGEDVYYQRRPLVAYWPVTKEGETMTAYAMDRSGQINERRRQPRFVSVQSGSAVLAALSEKGELLGTCGSPAYPCGARVEFSAGATASPIEASEVTGWKVELGSVTAYLYPVSTAGGSLKLRNEDGKIQLERAWTDADQTAGLRTLAYLIVFRLEGEPEPEIGSIALRDAAGGWLAAATVNGERLELPIRDFAVRQH